MPAKRSEEVGEAGREVLVEACSLLAVEDQASQERKGSGRAEPSKGTWRELQTLALPSARPMLFWCRPFVRRVNQSSS